MVPKNRKIVLLFSVMVIAMLSLAACGTDSGADEEQAPANEPASSDSSLPTDGETTSGLPAAAAGTGDGGLDAACVELVLGRSVTGFGDVTDSERTRIFEECSSGGGGGGRLAAGFDPTCVESALGSEITDFQELTAEQRQTVFEACGGDSIAVGPPGGGEGRPGAGLGAQGEGVATLLENECIQNAVGRPITDASDLSQQEIFAAIQSCADSLELPEGGLGGGQGFGGGQGGFGQRPRDGRGGFGGDQASPAN